MPTKQPISESLRQAHGPVMDWQFLRRHFVRIVIAVVLMAAVYGVVSVYGTYQREQRIAKAIASHGGDVAFQFAGPDWIPQTLQDRLPFLDRICRVCQLGPAVPSDFLCELGALNKLEYLHLENTQANDAVLKHFMGLTNLKTLYLNDTQVTDAGMAHLNGLTNLTCLTLDDTQVTADGRALLRKSLPNCTIEPTP